MKITAEKDQQSQYIVRIEIDPAELEEAKGKAAKKLSNQLRIPGFRPGKAPRALVERFVGQEALIEQATRDLLPKAYENALKQEDIKPIANPEYNIESVDPLTIVATIPVEPSVELGKYQDIRFEATEVNVTDEEVQKVIEQLVEQQSTWEEPDTERPAQDGDQVEVELTTVRDGEPTGEPFQRTGVLGKGELLAQMDEQVAGMNVGEEKTIEINRKPAQPEPAPSEAAEPEAELPEVETIPLDEDEAEAAPMVFKAKLNSIKIKHSPEINDEFAQSVTDVQTVDELKERVRKNLQAQKESDARRELTEKIVKEAVGISTVTMPPVLVNSEIHALEENMANRLKQQKLNLDQYLSLMGKSHDIFHEELRPQAEDRIKTALVLREIARAEGITVEEGDLDREVEKMVDDFTLEVPEDQKQERGAAMRGYLGQEQTRNQLRDELFSRKLSERLIELVTGNETATVAPPTDEEEAGEAETEAEADKPAAKAKPKSKATVKSKAETDPAQDEEAAPVAGEEDAPAKKPRTARAKAKAGDTAESDSDSAE